MRTLAQLFGAFTVILLTCLFAYSAGNDPDGAALYDKNCSSCHATDGSGNTNAKKKMSIPNLLDKKFVEMSDKQMFDTIAHGKEHKEYPHTYLYTGMNEQQIQDIVGHIRKLQKK